MSVESHSRHPISVTEAVYARKSVRQFTGTPVSDDLIRELLGKSARSASGGNLQPWRIYVVNGDAMGRFREMIADVEAGPGEYDIYPPNLWEPYRTNRFALGEAMYATIGIERDDKEGRLAQFAKNKDFFGAPAALFCFVDRKMGPPQWSDLGMFLHTFMLLAIEAGLGTCAQEFWSGFHQAVQGFVAAPDEEMLFCGMAIGYEDTSAAINSLESQRMPLDEWARFV